MFVIIMYVSGGFILEYMFMCGFGFMNNFFVYILSGFISLFNVIVIKFYMEGILVDVEEFVMIDGVNDFLIFWKIILLFCVFVIVIISLFIVVGYWNLWFDIYFYCLSELKFIIL